MRIRTSLPQSPLHQFVNGGLDLQSNGVTSGFYSSTLYLSYLIINLKERLRYHPKICIKKIIAVCSLLVGLERIERSPLDFQSNERTMHTAVPIKNSSISTGIKFIAGLFSPEDFFSLTSDL